MSPTEFNDFIASNQFIALCESQLILLSEGIGASWSAVYLNERFLDDSISYEKRAKLTPVVMYPPGKNLSKTDQPVTALPKLLGGLERKGETSLVINEFEDSQLEADDLATSTRKEHGPTEASYQSIGRVVFPLIYDEVVMGLLVAVRDDGDWEKEDLKQIEKISETLAIAHWLDQRQYWYEYRLQQQQEFVNRESNRLDDLLHQLRSPLTALRTFTKLLFKRFLARDRNFKVVQGMLREGDRIEELLKNFQSSSQLLHQNHEPLSLNVATSNNLLLPVSSSELETIKIIEILEPLVNSAQTLSQEQGIKLETKFGNKLPLIKANSSALREVLSNLIDNAIKYTPSGGHILITTQENDGEVGIIIKDNGYGIPPEDQVHIFERHYRGVQAQGEIPGTGLGLPIAKDLVEKMEGRIELISPNREDESSLVGSTFMVWLSKSD